jgi:hypothetical protein
VARLLSAVLKAAMFAERTDDGLLMLLTIEHPSEPAPIRLVADGQAVTSRGDLYEPFPFDITLPDDEEDQSAVAKFVGDNVSRRIIGWLRTLSTAPTGLIEVVKISAPDVVELAVARLQFLEPTTPDSMTITCDMQIVDTTQQRYLKHRYVPSSYPALGRAAA